MDAVSNTPRSGPGPWLRISIVIAFVLAAGLIFAAATGDLWLDEIWSIGMARRAQSVADVFTLRHDNNHPLNTLYLYALGEASAQWRYRLASVLCGIAAIGLLAASARRQWGEREALLFVALCGASFPIVLYSSEARGYAMLMLLAATAYLSWLRWLRTGGWASVVVFWLACALGLLAHATFVIVLVAFGLGQIVADRRAASPRRRMARMALVLAVPALFAAWWYWFFLDRLVFGGGNPSEGWPVIREACSLLLGWPDSAMPGTLAFGVVLGLVAAGVRELRRRGDGQWLFFLCVILVAPALVLAITHGRDLQPRYFIAAFPFFLLLSSRLFFVAWDGARGSRSLLLLALAVFFAGNLFRDYFLLTVGRGEYSRAITYMLAHTPPGPVLVGGTPEFRNHMLVQFHAARLAGGERVRFVDDVHVPNSPPRWYLTHSQSNAYLPPPDISVAGAGHYRLERRYGYAGSSGWRWFLYRRVP